MRLGSDWFSRIGLAMVGGCRVYGGGRGYMREREREIR